MHSFINSLRFGIVTACFSSVLLASDPVPQSTENIENTDLSTKVDHTEGMAIFAQCGACHLANGDGVKNAFPPLKNRLAGIGSSPEGRLYLQSVLLQGLNGPITVDGDSYNGYMQSYASILDDQQISLVLNYVSQKLADEPTAGFNTYSSDEVAATRLLLKSDAKSSNELRKDAIE